MVLVDTKSFLFGHGTLKMSLQTENHLNGWLSVKKKKSKDILQKTAVTSIGELMIK